MELTLYVLEDIAGLTVKRFADGFECFHLDGLGFSRFKYGKVNGGNANFICQFIGTHFPFGEHHVYVDYYWHIK
jgi:hypothetical protein